LRIERPERVERTVCAQNLGGTDKAGADLLDRVRQISGLNFLQPINSGLTLVRIGIAQNLLKIVKCPRIEHRHFAIR
jgi:hypothetical protein